MSLRLYSVAEQLEVIEGLIEQIRMTESRDDLRLEILKSVAQDLRARVDHAPTAALFQLQARLAKVLRSKENGSKYKTGTLVGVADELIARWPVVKQALERFEAEQ